MDLKTFIRDIPDFPKTGILFKDITTLLKDSKAFKYSVDQFISYYIDKKIDYVAAVEARGYIMGGILAYNFNAGFVPIRKPGKLPYEVHSIEYTLEYGSNILEVHKDAINPGSRVLIFDDLIATGGSAFATAKLIEQLGGEVSGFAFIIELSELKGREKLKDYDVFSLIVY
ncbi:MAG TPA: adenine phosphoribosyltransferase [Candidatus Eremiobacteraeota bacterium]|mgnify:CR=1 FL=1|nr:MAG: Adenine phosphoribosyltransferase [bacterium ADurb.Bin363]HPZ08421.1 adenine phosphoribosyltransferase [Candidatus Eremiobacteraeota bacterium]